MLSVDYAPHVSWDSVVGHVALKERLLTICGQSLPSSSSSSTPSRVAAFLASSSHAPNGILLHGPSGCGKSFLAHALAHKLCSAPLAITPAGLLSGYVGESESRVREIFKLAKSTPESSVIVVDDIDLLCPKRGSDSYVDDSGVRDRIISAFLNELDGVSARGHVRVIACSNAKELIDEALLRPGRFDFLEYVNPPSESDVLPMLNAAGIDFSLVNGWSIAGICRACELVQSGLAVDAAIRMLTHSAKLHGPTSAAKFGRKGDNPFV
jgi:SpoVK/Ycf46/Vps4 family AAA+-type ATPase